MDEDSRLRIIRFMRRKGAASSAQIAKGADLKGSLVHHHVKSMLADGLLLPAPLHARPLGCRTSVYVGQPFLMEAGVEDYLNVVLFPLFEHLARSANLPPGADPAFAVKDMMSQALTLWLDDLEDCVACLRPGLAGTKSCKGRKTCSLLGKKMDGEPARVLARLGKRLNHA